MIKLSTIKQLSRQVISNPIKSVKRVVSAITPRVSHLESSPARDTLVRVNPQNYILGASPKKMIQELTAKKSSSFGKDASVFALPNQENLILRVEHSAIEKMENLADDLKLIPINHSENALAHENLGLPLYSVVSKDSELFARESISPREALAQKDNIMILKRVTGQHPAKAAFDSLLRLMGVVENEPNVPQYLNFHKLGFINKNYGKAAAKECLDIMKKGGTQTIPANHFFEGSEEFTFTNCETFTENYKAYVDAFLSYLKDVSKMPKKSFKEAVDTILMKKDFLIDFQHTNNTFVDVKNKRFNFMDFEYDKSNKKYIYDNPVREFRNVLLGKCFCAKVNNPRSLLLDDKDIALCDRYFANITKKVNDVTPDEFKFE